MPNLKETNNSYSFDVQKAIIDLKSSHSSRQIADHLNISKSGVNDFYAKHVAKKIKMSPVRTNGPRILFFDLETSAALVYCFGRHKQFISQDAVEIEGGKILCAGYRWGHETESKVIAYPADVSVGTDYAICKELWDLFNEADAVVAHNAKNFDVKMLEVRCLVNGLPALPTVKVIDTLEIAKQKFRFPSNKLDSLGSYLELGRKVQHSGMDLWVRVQKGDGGALKEMIAYCKQDVDLLVEIYETLLSRGLLPGINFSVYYSDTTTRCKSCGSTHLEHTGRIVTTSAGLFEEIKCNSCGSLQKLKQNKLSINKRRTLLG